MRSSTIAGNLTIFQMLIRARYFVLLGFLLFISLAGFAQNVTLNYTTAGPYTFVVPPGVTSITVQTWGAGGGGGGGRDARGGSGGGGGAYTLKTFNVTPGQQYNITVGAGGAGGNGSGGSAGDGGPSQVELNGGSVVVIANGGLQGLQESTTPGTGGLASVDPDATDKFKGGDGFGGGTTAAGGGGSSAGTASDGVNATSSSGATAPAGGGSGGSGTSGTGGSGNPPGGGGAGGDDTDGDDGGAGGDGKVIITYTDNTAPTVTNVTSSTPNATYSVGVDINVTITFSEPVIVAGGTPRIQLETGTTDRYATYNGGTGTNTLTFTYTVVAGDNSGDLDYLSMNALEFNGATIRDNANNNATLTLAAPAAAGSLGANSAIVINTPALVTGVTSSPNTGAFKFGSPNIIITITFNKAVTVVGTPTLTLETGATDQVINNTGGSGTTALTFTYVIQNNDNTADLDYKAANSLTAGTSIQDALGTNANLALPAPGAAGSLGANSSIVIDNIIPSVSVPNLATADDTGFKNDDNITKNTTNLTFTGTAEAGSTVRIYNNVTEIGSGTATGGNYSIDVNLGAGDYTQINATATDAAGNASNPTSALTPKLTIDVTKPTTGVMTFNASQTGKETITWTFSEAITSITNGSGGSLADFDMTGFSVAASTPGYEAIDTNPAPSYTNSTLEGKLFSSSNDSGWDGGLKIDYSSGNIYDVAGNAMDPFTDRPVSDIEPPKLLTGLVFNPAGVITFQVDEELNVAELGNLTGLTTAPASTFTAVYTGKGTTNTITLTYTGGTAWTDNVTVTYSGAGNIVDAATSPNHLVMAAEPILLKSITTFSNNAIPNTNYATTGQTVTVTFASSRTLTALPSVTIAGIAATVTPPSGPFTGPFTATATMTVGVTEGIIPISITAQETGKTTVTSYTTDGSSVIFDKTPPAVTNVSFTSNNGFIGTDYFATTGDLVTLTFTIVESFVPVVTIGGSIVDPGDIFNDGFNNYTVTVSPDAFTEGLVTFSIVVKDLANNTTTKTTTDNGTTVTFDNTPPTVSSIAINPAKINPYAASINGTTPSLPANNNEVDFLITFDDPVTGVSSNNIIATKTGSVSSLNNPTILAVQSDGITPVPFGQPTKYWLVIYSNVNGAGLFKIQVAPSFGNIQNIFGLSLSTGLVGPDYTISLPEPVTPVGLISVSAISDNSITVNWGTVTGATHYLVILTTNPTASVNDGTYVPNDNIFGDGTVVQNIAQGTNSATFNEPPANSAYNIFIYPYALSPFTTGVNNTAIDFNSTPSDISRSANIIRDLSFTYPQNIDYKLYLASGVDLERFSVSDGGGLPYADGLPTILTGLTLNNISNWQNLSTLSLFDGGTPVGVPIVVTGSSVTFSGLSFNVAEGTTKTLTVKGIFKTTVTDNQVISFNLSAVTASQTGSSQFLDTSLAIASNPTAQQNKIEVVATQIDFTTVPTSASISVPMTIQVSARDVNANLDLDYNGTITDTDNTSPGSFTTINDPTGAFTAGIKDYPVNFQFTTGNGPVQLTINSGAGSGANNVNAGAITGTSPVINVISSFESVIVSSDLYDGTSFDINYIDYQDADITGTTLVNTNGFKLDLLYLADGGWDVVDADGAPTILDDLTLGISNPESIQKIAIYHQPDINNSAITEIQELDNSNIVVTNGYGQITFTNLNITSDDDQYTGVVVLVTFNNSPATIQDRDLIQVSVIDATLNPGSKFAPDAAETGTIGGEPVNNVTFPSEASTVQRGSWGPYNYIQAVATSLDFVTQPSVYAGIDEPITGVPGTSPGGSTGIVHARDKFAVLDTDFAYSATVTAAATPKLYPSNFTAGVLNLSTMQYDIAGLGALTVSSNGLSSDNEPWATSEKSDPVDVIHVTASLPQNPNNGVVTSPSLKGGTSNIVIFGFDIYPTYSTAVEPELDQFSITFDVPYQTTGTTILKDFKVFESLVGTFSGSANVLSLGATVTEGQSQALIDASAPIATKDMITVNFPTPRSLKNRGQGNPITYFLVVNIDATANLTTPKITPQLVDGGFGSPKNDNGHILTSIGSSSANVIGTQFGFASTRPPSLVNSEPKNGALNVDPNQSTVKLYFDVGVWSHDRYILLWERYSNTLVDTLKLTGSYGFYPGAVTDPKATPAIPLTFSIPDPSKLIADSVYYITIAKGTFDPNTKKGTGISDDGFNLYGGLSFNGGLYFKIASENPPVMLSTDPNKYYPSATGASINASFDQKEGIAYYMVVLPNATAPTSAMIKGTDLSYPGVVARGSFTIDQVNPNLNSGIFNVAPDLINNRTFDVWMYAENGAPAKVPSGPYGNEANDYLENTTGPTFSIVIPKATNTVYLNKPAFQICANSDVTLTDPIIIEESTLRSEFNGGSQNFNLLLPSGFTFDVNAIPTIQSSGGIDFIGGFSHQYVNSTILRISFTNSGSSSQDKIVISNLKVRASASDLSGSIIRFAGNAFASAPSTLGDGVAFATIASGNIAALDFSNSYTTSNNFDAAPITITNPVTAIPDNYVDPDTKLGPFAVRLSPIVPKGDYGPSTFSGNGVTNDVLSLSGVPLNTAFDITMTHVDLNGCVSDQVVQYEVYDHTQAIPALVDATYGIKDYIVNPNYLMNQPPPPFSNVADSVSRNFKAGYSLIELFANIPTRATARDTVNLANNTATSQIMFGPAWQALVSQIPILKSLSNFNTTLGEYYRSYYYYYGPLMPLDPALDPYKYFDDFTPEGRKYFRGGSLGQVEFTGKFRSTADATVLTPIRQEIEVFIPAIPVIEISNNAISGFDITDPLRPDPVSWPKGTPIFCQSGTAITINGYPLATAGVSSGRFDIVDAANPLDTLYSSKIVSKRYGGFIDNLNGTAILTPGALKNQNGEIANAYKDIRIVYTFKDDASPIEGSGNLVIRITPNPVANFTTSNLCEDVDISFTDISTLSPGSGASIAEAIWSFGDNNASARDNADTIRYPSARVPVHIYSVVGNYTVGLTTITNFGCSSTNPPAIPQFTKTLSIGGTPNVVFDFRGVSTADPIDFVSTSTVQNDVIINEDWDFGDLSSVASGRIVSHTYSASAIYDVNLTVTSQKGCFNDSTRQVVILPRVIVSDLNVYSQNFETTNGGWMFYPTNATWQWTTATKSVIKNDANLNGQKVWITNNDGIYDRESYLYTASYDISALSRPMISLNSFVQMGSGDGVVIEFSTDNKNASDPTKEWNRLGTNTTGINWYNGQGLPSNPGNQLGGDYGWASTINGWQESKHSLSVNNLTSPAEKGKVVFRFALASVSARNPDGFALDNVRIGNRTRTVLIENFTNKGGTNASEKQVSDFLKSYIGSVGTEIVKINYHVGFPGPAVDPFNAINPADPSARALFYNVVKTPTTYMDGLTEKSDPLFTQWAQSKYDSQSLNLAGADIAISQTLSSTTGAYSVEVSVTAKKQLPANTILHVAFLEQDISLASNLPTGENKFEYVLKKLLPSGAGTRFNQVLNENQTRTFTGLEWTPDTKNLFAPSDDLVLVAFLQNETTLEVYQSELIAGITDPPVVTGIWDILPEQVNVYPNPASSEFRVELPAFVQNEASIHLIDLMGRSHDAGKIEAGSNAASVNVESLSEGIYILEIGSDKTGIIRKKIMVVMNK